MVQRSRRSPLAAGFQYRLLPSPQPGDRDRDSSCSSKDCNVANKEVFEQPITYPAPRPVFVAHRQFPLRRNLRKGEPEGLVQKARIVTEPIRPRRLIDNLARDFSAKRLEDPSPSALWPCKRLLRKSGKPILLTK